MSATIIGETELTDYLSKGGGDSKYPVLQINAAQRYRGLWPEVCENYPKDTGNEYICERKRG